MSGYWVFRLICALSRALPERTAYWVGLRIADALYRRDRKGREAVQVNLRQIFKARGIVPAEGVLNGFARKTFQYFGKYLVDFFRFARLTPEQIRARVSLEHIEYMDQCMALGRGVVMVTAHFGNWELGGAVLAGLGYPMNAVVLPQPKENVNRLFQEQRAARGLKVILMGRSPFQLLRCLKNKEALALLADRDFSGHGEPAMFFGRPVRMPVGPAWLACRTGAPVLVGFLIRQVDDTYLLRFYPPILPQEETGQEAVRDKINRILEKEIAERPYQWYMFESFWSEDAE